MDALVADITTTALTCTILCKNGGTCKADVCYCLPGYYGDFCQEIGYNGYSTIGAIAGAVICIVFLLLLTCMAFAAHIRGPPNGESRLTRLVSVEARGNSFDENSVLARNDFPPEYSEVVTTGRGRRLSRLSSRGNSIDEMEPRSPPPMYEVVIFGKKHRFSFRRGSKSRKASEIAEPNLDNKDCIIEEVNEKFGDDSVFTTENTFDVTGTAVERSEENATSEETVNTANSDSPQEAVEESLSGINSRKLSVYEREMNAKLEGDILDACVVETVTEIAEEQRHRQKHEDRVEHDEQISVETS